MLLSLLVSILSPQAVSAANIPSLPSKWIYVGCLAGNSANIMTDEFWAPKGLTIESCLSHCISEIETRHAALQGGNRCYCGDDLDVAQVASESNCNSPCPGDSSQMCGGSGYMSFFSESDWDPRVTLGVMAAPKPTSAAPVNPPTTSQAPAPAPGTTTATTVAANPPATVIQTTGGRQADPTTSSPGLWPGTTAVQSGQFVQSGQSGQSVQSGQPLSNVGTAPNGVLSSGGTMVANATFPGAVAPAASTTSIAPGGSSAKAPLPVLPTDSPAGSAAPGAIARGPRLRDNSDLIVFGKYASSAQNTYPSASLSVLLLIISVVYHAS